MADLPSERLTIVIDVTGRPGFGKTTVLTDVVRALDKVVGPNITISSRDDEFSERILRGLRPRRKIVVGIDVQARTEVYHRG